MRWGRDMREGDGWVVCSRDGVTARRVLDVRRGGLGKGFSRFGVRARRVEDV